MVASNEPRKCSVVLLDDQKLDIPLQPKLLSSDLLDIVTSHFTLKEKEYFGLCYYDTKDCLCWLRSDKKALDHDFPKVTPIPLFFCVRNYVKSVTILKDNVTIELFYLQARRHIFEGAIECDSATVFLLAAHVLQATHGDYVSDSIAVEDLKNLKVIPTRTLQEHPSLTFCEEKIVEHYRSLDGITKVEAILNYIGIVEKLPMYGVHYYDVKNKEQIPWKLGISFRGVEVFDFHDRTDPRKTFPWSQMENIFYRDKKFSIEYREGPRKPPSPHIKTDSNNSLNRLNALRRSFGHRIVVHAWYSVSSGRCRELWHMAVSQHQFFLEKRNAHQNGSQRSLRQMAKHLSKSSTSLSSMRSNNSAAYDNISDTASFYFSLDGESLSSSQMIEAEQDMLSALKTRRGFLEQLLKEKSELLNELCLREAELTGVVPTELPESPTHPGHPMRRKVGTAFEFDEAMLTSDHHTLEGREIESMERDYEIQRQITSAAQRLAMDPSVRKKVRKTRQISYQKALVKLKTMEQQLEYTKRETAKDLANGISKLTKKDEVGSNGDSMGPIDEDTLSSNEESYTTPAANSSSFARRPRDSMYLATPVITTSSVPVHVMNNLKERHVSAASVKSPRYDQQSNSYDHVDGVENNFKYEPRLPPRSHSNANRIKYRPPASPLVLRNKKYTFHNSADQLNELASPRSDGSDSNHQYLCGEFENTGMYSISIAKRTDYIPIPSLPHSYSSPGIASKMHASPNTLRRLQQLSLSPSQPQLLPSRYMMSAQSQSQSSLASSSELSECWSDVVSEETLV